MFSRWMTSSLAVILFCSQCFALPIPTEIKKLLLSKGRTDLIERFEAIRSVSPEEFADLFLQTELEDKQTPVGAGFNGITFKDSQNRITKFIFSIWASLGKVQLLPSVARVDALGLENVRKGWSKLLNSKVVASTSVSALRGIDGPVGSQPFGEELLGTLIWAAYSPRYTYFPDVVSSDGLAARGHNFEGIPLLRLLQSQRKNGNLHQKYNFHKIWREVIFWQRIGETMLRDIGVTIDMLTPGNMIVCGDPENPKIELIDNAIVRPSPDSLATYRRNGWELPTPTFQNEIQIIVWPTQPEHIVSSEHWSLNFEQAITYIMAYFEISNRSEAIERLSHIEEWPIVEAPILENYTNIRTARLIVNPLFECEMALGKNELLSK